jgi:hypothetical protein
VEPKLTWVSLGKLGFFSEELKSNAALQTPKREALTGRLGSTSAPQHKPHPEVLANVGDQEFAAGSQIQLLTRYHRGVDRHGLGDQPWVCAAQKFSKRASFHLRGISGHILGYVGKSGPSGLVGFFQEQAPTAVGS